MRLVCPSPNAAKMQSLASLANNSPQHLQTALGLDAPSVEQCSLKKAEG